MGGKDIDALLDQCRFELDDEQLAVFLGALDAPPTPNAMSRQLMASKSPWET